MYLAYLVQGLGLVGDGAQAQLHVRIGSACEWRAKHLFLAGPETGGGGGGSSNSYPLYQQPECHGPLLLKEKQ